MQFHPNELFLVYNPQSTMGKQTKAIAKDICNHVNEVDIMAEKLSPTYWKEIVNLLKMPPDQLLDKSHPDYAKKIGTNTYTMDGWLEVLVYNANMIKAPIAIYRGMAVFCETPTDIFKLRQVREEKAMPHLKSYKERD
ncbi:MAG: glutaredoxin [Cyclobacteriaceae bacterium]|nr:glutaredoxin [Cyclobacteriaceae bacterium]